MYYERQALPDFGEIGSDHGFRMRLRYQQRETLVALQGSLDGSCVLLRTRVEGSRSDDLLEHAVDPVDRIPVELNRIDETANEAFPFVVESIGHVQLRIP